MGGRSRPLESLNTTEQPAEKKKGFADWMNMIKPGIEEKDHWVKIRAQGRFFFFLSPANPDRVKAYLKSS